MSSTTDLLRSARKRTKEEKAQTSARFKEILSILKKYDTEEGLTPENTVALLEDLGTTFVKLGQIASTHPDVLPKEYCDALGSLRTNVRPLSLEEVKGQIEAELGKPVEEIFSEFDEKPLGSASIAQVHRVVLPDGTVVAVKVQRPGVVDLVMNDLAIMERLVSLYEMFDSGESGLSLKELLNELVKISTEELDFENEAANLDRFYANNESREGVTSPKCYRDYTTSAILTEDFVDAPCAEDIESLGKSEEEREKLAYLIASNYMQQVMEDGFYHADPHAGNLLVTKDGGIEWIDFGMMGTITSSQRETLSQLIMALAKGDAYGLKRSLLKIATPTGPIDHSALLEMCEGVTERFIDVDLAEFDTGEMLEAMTGGVEDMGFDIDPFLVNLGRGLTTLEGTIHHISPKLNIMTVLTEYLENSFDPAAVKKRAQRLAAQVADSAVSMAVLPTKAIETLDMLQKGHMKVGMELSSNERFSRDLRAVGGLVALALVAMGLIIGACIVGTSTTALTIGGMSSFSIAGLVVGVALAIYIIVKIRPYLKK